MILAASRCGLHPKKSGKSHFEKGPTILGAVVETSLLDELSFQTPCYSFVKALFFLNQHWPSRPVAPVTFLGESRSFLFNTLSAHLSLHLSFREPGGEILFNLKPGAQTFFVLFALWLFLKGRLLISSSCFFRHCFT